MECVRHALVVVKAGQEGLEGHEQVYSASFCEESAGKREEVQRDAPNFSAHGCGGGL